MTAVAPSPSATTEEYEDTLRRLSHASVHRSFDAFKEQLFKNRHPFPGSLGQHLAHRFAEISDFRGQFDH